MRVLERYARAGARVRTTTRAHHGKPPAEAGGKDSGLVVYRLKPSVARPGCPIPWQKNKCLLHFNSKFPHTLPPTLPLFSRFSSPVLGKDHVIGHCRRRTGEERAPPPVGVVISAELLPQQGFRFRECNGNRLNPRVFRVTRAH